MKLVFFNRFFYPDSSATSQILSDLAFHLAERHEVHVVTCRVPGGEADEESIRGVQIHRVASVPQGPHGLVRRAAAYFDYYRGARAAARRLVGQGDIVIAKTDPPMLSAVIGAIARREGARLIVWLQDLFPEIARQYGIAGFHGPLGKWLEAWRDHSLRESHAVIAIGHRMAERARRAARPDRVYVIENWADGTRLHPAEGVDAELRRSLGLEEVFLVVYSGNLGRVHEFDTLLSAAAIMRLRADLAFVIIGGGPRLAETRRRAELERLNNVIFLEQQPRASLLQSLNLADVHLVVLRPEFEGLVLPSKLYGAMAVGKPTILVGDTGGEVAGILRAAGAGLAVRTGDARGLADAVLYLQENTVLRRKMGAAARIAFITDNDMSIALARWEAVLDHVAGRVHGLRC